jgi:cysteine desulfurase
MGIAFFPENTHFCTHTRNKNQKKTCHVTFHKRISKEPVNRQDMKCLIHLLLRTKFPETMNPLPIYLDYQATTPCDPRVIEAMWPYLTTHFGNPHSRNHPYGWNAEEAVEKARKQIAASIGADPREIVFTSGATESNNLALKGLAHFYKKNHIITVITEHKCIIETGRALEQEGFRVTYLPVLPSGLLDLEELKRAISDDTLVVSVAAVNGEVGVIAPLAEIGALCREKGVFFHTDAAQALGKIPLDVNAMNIDLMSLSSHKIYGPKGIGALYVRRRPRIRLRPLIHGGGQERGLRSGTLAPFLCVGFGYAAEIAEQERINESARLKGFRDHFYATIMAHLDAVYLNGDWDQRVAGNLNLSFFGVEGEGLMMALKELAISSGSACTSNSLEPSYILMAMGVGDELAHTSLRITFGRFTTLEQVDTAAAALIRAVTHLRNMSPLWDMYQEGVDLKSVQWIAH